MTDGRAPERLAAILELLRPVAGEIVLAVDERAAAAAKALASHADRVATFPYAEPSDRPLPWLFGLCRGDWILNVDDDEVPSTALLGALPELVERTDITPTAACTSLSCGRMRPRRRCRRKIVP